MKVFVASSAHKSIPEHYIEPCQKLLNQIFKQGHQLTFGACDEGLMGISYFTALHYQCPITGVAPQVYSEYLKELKCSNKIYTNTIDERTDALVNNSDVALFLPGGTGTLYEFFNVLEKKKHNEIKHPIIIYNCYGFFDDLLVFLDKIYNEKFTNVSVSDNYIVINEYEDIISYLNQLEEK